MTYPTGIIINTIVQFDSLIPVVLTRCIIEMIITCSLGRFLHIRLSLVVIEVKMRGEVLTGTIIEIIIHGVEATLGIIILAQVLHSCRFTDRVILSSHMVGHKVDNDFQPSLMRTLDKCLELLHTVGYIHCQIRIYVIIVGNGIGRASLALYNSRMLARNTIGGIVGGRGMTDNSRVPDMTDTHLCQALQYFRGEIGHLSRAVLLQCTVFLSVGVPVSVETSEHLIDNHLTHTFAPLHI